MAIVPTLFLIQILKFCIPPICHFSEVATFPEYIVLAMPLSGHCHRSSKLPLFWKSDIGPQLPQNETDKIRKTLSHPIPVVNKSTGLRFYLWSLKSKFCVQFDQLSRGGCQWWENNFSKISLRKVLQGNIFIMLCVSFLGRQIFWDNSGFQFSREGISIILLPYTRSTAQSVCIPYRAFAKTNQCKKQGNLFCKVMRLTLRCVWDRKLKICSEDGRVLEEVAKGGGQHICTWPWVRNATLIVVVVLYFNISIK